MDALHAHYDGLDGTALARRLGVPQVVLLAQTSSTMDEAHARAAQGALPGTMILAESQTAGRGRSGGSWIAVDGDSILCTIIERPATAAALTVLSLRIGLGVAQALDAFADAPVTVKWPNDLFVGDRKVAGILVEARWRDQRPDWVATAIGVNVGAAPSGVPAAGGLRPGTSRLDVLQAIVPPMRDAAQRTGPLSPAELLAWRTRDRLRGRRVSRPVAGEVSGILPTGELVIETAAGPAAVRSGSIILEDS